MHNDGTAGSSGAVLRPISLGDELVLARSAWDRGEQEAALQIWAELRAEFPDHPAAYQAAAAALLGLGRFDEAETLLSDAHRRFPDDAGIAMERAQSAERRKDHLEAADRWADVQRLMPDHLVGHLRRGLALCDANRLDAAEALMQATVAKFPDNADAAIWYARLAEMQRHWPEALERWAHIRRHFPGSSIGYLGAAVSLRQAGQPKEEDLMLAAAVERFPDDAEALVGFASAAVRRRDWPEMLRRWELMKIRFPGRPTGYTGMAVSLREMGRMAEAESLLSEAIARFPDEPSPAIEYALHAQHSQDWQKALVRWQAVQQRFPSLPVGFRWSALALRMLQRHSEAERVLSGARERFPQDAGILTESAHVATARMDWPAAAEHWATLVSQAPEDLSAQNGLSLALLEQGRIDECEAVLSAAIQRFPSNRDLVIRHIEIARLRNDWTQMLARLTAAAERFPSDSDIQRQLHETRARVVDADLSSSPSRQHRHKSEYLLFVANPVGIGHLLTGILHSAYFAYRTGRAFALDMRESLYFRSDKHNAFFECFGFEFPPDLKIVTDIEEIRRISAIEDQTIVSFEHPLDISRPSDRTVLIVPCATPGEPYHLDLKRPNLPFRVVLRGHLREAWDRVLDLPQWTGPVIGIHFRAFVGEIGPRMNRYLVPDFDARCDALRDQFIDTALLVAKEEGYTDPAFLVTSDDARFVSHAKRRLPNSFSFATRLPESPDQSFIEYLRLHDYDLSILSDTVNDLWALSECDNLIYSTRSGFSYFASLNSIKLDRRRTRAISIPLFGEILRSLDPEIAAQWARAAARKIDAIRFRDTYLTDEIALALERGGDAVEAAAARRRTAWYNEACRPAPRVKADGEHPAVAEARARAADLPQNPYVLAGYGDGLSEVLERHGHLDQAIEAAYQAIGLEPLDPYLQDRLGRVLVQAGRSDEAEAAFRRAVELEPDVGPLWLHLGDCLARQKRWDVALTATETAIALEPNNAHWHARRGELLLATNQLEKAELAITQAIALNPRVIAFPHLLSIVRERQQRFDSAASAARQARELEPTNPAWSLRIGQLLQRAGRFDAAKQAYTEAQELDPNSTEARNLLAMLGATQITVDR